MKDSLALVPQAAPDENPWPMLHDLEWIALQLEREVPEKAMQRAWAGVWWEQRTVIPQRTGEAMEGLSFAETAETARAFLQQQVGEGGNLNGLPLRLIVTRDLSSGQLILNWCFSRLHFHEKEMASVIQRFADLCESKDNGGVISPGFLQALTGQHESPAGSAGYWKNKLAGITRTTPLALSEEKIAGPYGTVNELWETLSAETSEKMQEFCLIHNVPLEVLVQGAWAILLGRYGNEHDIVFCTDISANHDDDKGGMNLMLGRITVDPQAKLLDWLFQLRVDWSESRSYEAVPMTLFSATGSPLPLDTVCNFHLTTLEDRLAGTGVVLSLVSRRRICDLPLAVDVCGGAEVKIRATYRTKSYGDKTIQRLLGHFKMLLESLTTCAAGQLGRLPWASDAEQKKLLIDWNETGTKIPADGRVNEMLEQQCARTPDAVAITFEGTSLTYTQLHERANALALTLREKGVGPDSRVAILVERSLEMVIGLLAIWKAGGAYVPLDPEYPKERVSYMLEDCGARVLLTQKEVLRRLNLRPEHLAVVDLDEQTAVASTPPDTEGSSQNLAYVIYTSGSTGKPKGVMLTHRNLGNFFVAMDRVLGVEPGVWLAVTSISFDISVLELFWTLARGFKVVIQRSGKNALSAGKGATVAELIHQHQVTHLQCTPSLLKGLLADPQTGPALGLLKGLLLGGEALPPALIQELKGLGVSNLYNMYGPTETTVWSAAQKISWSAKTVVVGKPLANTQIYLLTDELQPVPVGCIGEIYIGGEGVARGYLNRPELTEERFVPDPFKLQAGARIYRTGDLGRWLEDGTIECLGRSDNQVKLRGQRIELGEIEAALCQCAGIREAAVIVQGDADSEKRLIAYVVSTTENSPDSAEIKAKLKEVLHEAMMPSAFIFLDKLPLTPNGKIDRKALPQSQANAPVVLPESRPKTASHMENEIISIWAGILKMEAARIGLTDNFFELGGHSLLVVQMHSRLKEKLGADLPLARLFQYTTPASLAAHLNEGKESQMQSTLQRGALKRRGFKNPAKKQEELPV